MASSKSVFLSAGFCACAFVATVCAQSRPPLIGFVDEVTLDQYGMVRKWHTQVPTLRVRERVLSIKQQEDLLFVASDKGLFHCLDSETGRILWSQTVSDSASDVFPPALTKDHVYVTSGTRMSQLDRKTGSIILTANLRSAATSGPGANSQFCYVQTVDNRISAIRMAPDPDEEFQKWPFKRKYTLPFVQWYFDAGSALNNPPIVLKDRVLFTSANGVVFASVLNERSLFFRYIPGAPIAAPVSFHARTLYVATVDYNLFAVDSQSGKTVWRFASGYPIYRQPVPVTDDVYLTPEGGGMFAIDNADGTLRWVNESASRVVAVSQGRVYAMSPTMRFLVMDRKDGAIVGGWQSNDFPITAYNQTSDRIFLATERGLILCLAEKANIKPFLHDSPASVENRPQPPSETPPSRKQASPTEEGDDATPQATHPAEKKPTNKKPAVKKPERKPKPPKTPEAAEPAEENPGPDT